MDAFIASLLRLPILDVETERELARRCRTGDQAARAELISSGMRLVAMRARMRGFRGEELKDAVQSGAVGLIEAVDRFDPERGFRLATYAWPWIGGAMTPRDHDLPLDGMDFIVPAPEEPADVLELVEGLESQLMSLIKLRFRIGETSNSLLPRREVARLMGLTVSQVRTLEGQAMRQLRTGLARVCDRAPH